MGSLLEHATVAEAVVSIAADDDVIQNADAHHFSHLLQPPRNLDILGARRRVAARMVVDKDHRGGGFADDRIVNFARVDERRGERTFRNLHFADLAVFVVQQDDVKISEGSLTASLVHPREVYNPVIRESAAAVIFVHNHPSGDPAPSPEDIEITRRLKEVGDVMGVRVLDHIVIGHDRYFSFSDKGML